MQRAGKEPAEVDEEGVIDHIVDVVETACGMDVLYKVHWTDGSEQFIEYDAFPPGYPPETYAWMPGAKEKFEAWKNRVRSALACKTSRTAMPSAAFPSSLTPRAVPHPSHSSSSR